MNAYLNYIIEANIGLLLLLGAYRLLLAKETNFRMMRMYLLASIFASLLFPMFDLQLNSTTFASSLSVGRVIPTYWLPEVAINGEGNTSKEIVYGFWTTTAIVYASGLTLFFLLIACQLVRLAKIIRNSKTYRIDKLHVAESTEEQPTFSFFNFIFIGNARGLSQEEKEQIIRHESVHAQQWHSFDILLVNVLKILFWFNPFINAYKRTLTQLHEFEADTRAVEGSDVNKYCSLLARVALQSADFKLANHFNNSLTVKRIKMMRTIKSNIKGWRVAAIATALPIVFFFVACQDQVGDDIMQITQNSSHALIVPEYIQAKYEQLKKENPDRQYALLELNETASGKLDALKKQYGLPKSISVFKTIDGKEHNLGTFSVKPMENGGRYEGNPLPQVKPESGQTFVIVEFNEETNRIAEEASGQDKIFTVVEEAPEFPGGYDAMMAFIRENMRYPSEARLQGIEGTVYISFIVGADGAVSDAKPVRGISQDCDAEAKRVVESFPNWIPGKQGGKAVSVRFVLPLKYKLNQETPPVKN